MIETLKRASERKFLIVFIGMSALVVGLFMGKITGGEFNAGFAVAIGGFAASKWAEK